MLRLAAVLLQLLPVASLPASPGVLVEDDECSRDGECALQALQRRAVQGSGCSICLGPSCYFRNALPCAVAQCFSESLVP